MPSLLVTNDFPPKVGGIQTYLGELWRRLPPGDVTVLTTAFPGAAEFDAAQPFRIERIRRPVMLPSPGLARDIDALAREVGAGLIFLDPALPLGALGRFLRSAPHALIVHGAEVTVPAHLPGSRALLGSVLRAAGAVVAAGHYPALEAARCAGRALPTLLVPPGVDTRRFHPSSEPERDEHRRRFGLDPQWPLVVGVSRLVPRKGFDVLIDAVGDLDGVHLALAGTGRDRSRLESRARSLGGRVHFLGRVADENLPAVAGMGDVFAMICRSRWAGLEEEGFGIVFLEAAACGVPSVAGRSGGAGDAVADGATGTLVAPTDRHAVSAALRRYLEDGGTRDAHGDAALARARSEFDYDVLAARLATLAAVSEPDLGALPLYAARA